MQVHILLSAILLHTMESHTYKKMIDRLSRAEGQIRALKEILEKGNPDCTKFITQIKAARSALKGVSEEYIIHHIGACQGLAPKKRTEQISEAIKLLAKD